MAAPASSKKSALAYNLSRIARVLSPDLLASALGVSEDVLGSLFRDNDPMLANQYHPRMAEKLAQGNLPPAWLWTPNVTLLPEHIDKLRKLAAQGSNKSPIRRENFLKLVKAFEDNVEMLADALDMTLQSVLAVAEGRLPLDEQRFGHINPTLIRAGFPDGWLEEDNAKVAQGGIERLRESAADLYERDLSLYDAGLTSDNTQASNSQTNTTPENLPSTMENQSRFPATESNQTAMDNAQTPQTSSQQATFLKAAPITNVLVPPPQPPRLPGASAAPAETHPTVSTEAVKVTTAEPGNKPKDGRKTRVPTVDPVVHQNRCDALEQLIKSAPNSPVSSLFQDALNGHATNWSSLRRGQLRFKDELARKIEEVLELPSLWLDNPVFPPATLVAWMTDVNAPRPAKKAVPAKEGSAAAAPRTKVQPKSEQVAQPETARIVEESAPQPQVTSQTQTPAPAPERRTSDAKWVSLAPQTTAASKVSNVGGMQESFDLPNNIGPVARAALTTVVDRIKSGALTEVDALKLLNQLILAEK